MEGLLIQNLANIQSVNALVGEFDIQKRAVPGFCEFTNLTALNSLFEEIPKMIPLSRCPVDPTSVQCRVKVDSYKAYNRFNNREYGFVRI